MPVLPLTSLYVERRMFDLSGESRSMRARIISLRAEGIDQVVDNIDLLSSQLVKVCTYSSLRTAKAVEYESMRHTPYKTGELLRSAYIRNAREMGYVEDATAPNGEDVKMSDYMMQTSFGNKPYNEWWVGYEAEHALTVHENADNHHIVDYPVGNPPQPPEFAPYEKWDHYLTRALHTQEGLYSKRMLDDMQATIARFAVPVPTAGAPGRALASGGAPRLRKVKK